MAQHRMGLCHRIGTAAFSPKAIGMTISQTLRDGIETEQVQSLHGSIAHRGNPQATPLAVTGMPARPGPGGAVAVDNRAVAGC